MRPKAAMTTWGRLAREDKPRAYWENVMQQWIFCAADRRMLAAYHFDGATQEAIAEQEELSVQTVQRRLEAGTKRMIDKAGA